MQRAMAARRNKASFQKILDRRNRKDYAEDLTYEGTLRKAGFCNQGVVDEVRYSILEDEYGKMGFIYKI